jgi:hypothetical protein
MLSIRTLSISTHLSTHIIVRLCKTVLKVYIVMLSVVIC